MKIKYHGYATFTLSTDLVTVITDPNASAKEGIKTSNINADIVVLTDKTNKSDIKAEKRDSVFVIDKPGEFEISEIMIQRPLQSNYYIIDSDLVRAVYIGLGSQNIDPNTLKDLDDVDVLLLPVGNGDTFPSYEILEKIIEIVDPIKLVPFGYKDGKIDKDIKSLDDFIKHFGFTNSREETTLRVDSAPEQEERTMEVVILK